MGVVALTIARLSRRSPLISHTRVGWLGAPLPMLKFRTMWAKDEPATSWFSIEEVSAEVPIVKNSHDPRVTSRFASFCRRFSLDELPQLYHVVRGEMSLVGPRPVTRIELETYYGDDIRELVSLRPGLTGLWQIAGRSGLSYEDRKRLDLLLVREASLALYIRILLRSIPKVLTGSGAC
jgi:exopolysaccharide production protein ExoY